LYFLFTLSLPLSLHGQWYDPDWSSRRPIIVDNTGNPDTLVDFQVDIVVPFLPGMQTDFDDIRFTIADCVTPIPYWIEESFDSNYALAWVKVPLIPALDTTILYLYYENPNATSQSNGYAVFEYFDDFEDQNINDWTQLTGSWTATNYFLQQTILGNHQKAYSSYSFDFPAIAEAKMNYLSTYGYAGVQIFFLHDISGYNGYKFGWSGISTGGSRICRIEGGGVFHLVTDLTINVIDYNNQWLKERVSYDGNGYFSLFLKAPDSVSVFLETYDFNFGLPFILGAYGSEIGIDNLRIRKYTDPEPITSIGEEEFLIEPDHYDSTSTGQVKTYPIYVENPGQTSDIVEITKQWTQQTWTLSIRDAISGDTLIDHNGNGIPDLDTVYSNETRYLFVDVLPTDSTFAGVTDTTTLYAYFSSDSTISDYCTIVTKIITDISLSIEPNQSGVILPGESIDYSLDITNNGNVKDVVDVTAIQTTPLWSYELFDSTGTPLTDHNGNWIVDIDTLDPFGTTCEIVARITSPGSSSPGDIDTTRILARFAGYPTSTDTAILITSVLSPGSTLVLIDPDQSGFIDAGSTRFYDLTVRNLGSTDDVIDIEYTGTHPGWSCSLLDSTGNPLTDTDSDGIADVGVVPPSQAVSMEAGITASSSAIAGETDSTILWAISSIDTTVKDNARLITMVNTSVAVLIEPDCSDSASPQDTVIYTLTVSNLGNSPDIIDITYVGGHPGWNFSLVDANGLPLQDSDGDSRPDVGTVPSNGSVTISAHVIPPDSALSGDTDSRIVYATSSNNENIFDTATLTTYVTGSVTLFIVEPDYTEQLEYGMERNYSLWVILDGTAQDYVEIYSVGAASGWDYEILDSQFNRLNDTNSNGMLDLGWMQPGDSIRLNLSVQAPSSMAGIDSLGLRITVTGETERYHMEDSAVIYSYIVPIFDIHNYESPFTYRTTFRFSIPAAGEVYLDVYNRLGERVRKLLTGQHYQRGVYTLRWDGRNESGNPLAPAVYYYVFRLMRDTGDEGKIMKKTAIVR
jgi:uncharacterized membrane protein